ncbi:hypothetical protein HPP92_016544 [Vanilla planifolia]|uniref:H(+)/Pi cotransporter n=1 Tax=Vanilla planifolia TaxID=51239 RepID=A0A835QHR5_VANPL|nr:hypothetical protein HPP92_016544 [Vanilla planifolia]
MLAANGEECGDLAAVLLPLTEDHRGCDEGMGVDEMLRRFVGEFGPWQLRQFLLASIAWALNALHTMVVVFANRDPDGRDSCSAAPLPGWRAVSTVEEWGLTCGGERFKVGLAQTAFFSGAMIGAAIFGHLSDTFLGRKGALTLSSSLNATFGILTAFSPAFWSYAALRFLTGLSTGGVGLSAFVLATEPVGPTRRASVAMSTFFFFSIGASILSLIAFFVPSWRLLYIATSFPSVLFIFLALPFISESPRWHHVRRNHSAAMSIMLEIAKTNGSTIPDRAYLVPVDSGSSTASIFDVLQSPLTRSRLLLAVAINLLGSVVYYGLTLNVGSLGTDLHFAVVMNAVAELPAYAMTAVALRWCGRRPMTTGTLWLSGASCIAGGMLVGNGQVLMAARLLCAAVGIFAEAGGFDLLYIYTAELFPTVVRNAALGCVTLAGQLGAMAAPMVVAAGGRWPFVVFGACGMAAGALGWFLPETCNRPLYETLEALEGGEAEKPSAGG